MKRIFGALMTMVFVFSVMTLTFARAPGAHATFGNLRRVLRA